MAFTKYSTVVLEVSKEGEQPEWLKPVDEQELLRLKAEAELEAKKGDTGEEVATSK